MQKGYITVQILKPNNSEKLVVKDPVKPEEFFQKRTGLYVWSDFIERIVSKAKQTKAKTYALESYDLVRSSKDEEIESALGKKHLFSESEVCAIIAELISQQPKGEKGTLLADYNWNLFYTPSFVVHVYWDGDEWRVYAWGRGGREWLAGRRVFSPAN